MEKLDVKWAHAIRIWWALLWRTLILITLNLFIAGIAVGQIFSVLNMPLLEHRPFLFILTLFIYAISSLRILKTILSKNFGDYRIMLVKTNRFKA